MRPTYLTTETSPDRFIAPYGQEPRQALLSDHLDLFRRAGGVHRPSPTDLAGWAVVTRYDGQTVAYPVVCSEIIEVWDEDGRHSGRCGHPALDATGTCPAHDPRPYDS